MEEQVRQLRVWVQRNDKFASKLRATKSKIERHDANAPRERPKDQSVTMKLEGGRTGKRAVVVEGLGFPGIVEPFDTEVIFNERIGVLGLNGTGKSHFLRLLAGSDVAHTGEARVGARVVPGHFSQTHEHPELIGKQLLEVLLSRGLARGQAMATLRRYELDGAPNQPFETLSGGQQARLQVLLLDEPTDNLDVVSAEALESAIASYTGTVLAVTHDRWLMDSFDRFIVFHRDGTVSESLEPIFS
jgi:ATPase subunit of ABC transporter with duplicated ATPase domains